MSRFPDISGGDDLVVETLNYMIPQYYVKTSTSPKTNNTYANDPELAGIPLEVGTYHVAMLFGATNAAATGDIKTTWTFTGSWNDPIRHCLSSASANTGVRNAITDMTCGAYAASASTAYGLAASSAWTTVREDAFAVIVTVAGDLALTWAQNTTDAGNATSVTAQSACVVRRIA